MDLPHGSHDQENVLGAQDIDSGSDSTGSSSNSTGSSSNSDSSSSNSDSSSDSGNEDHNVSNGEVASEDTFVDITGSPSVDDDDDDGISKDLPDSNDQENVLGVSAEKYIDSSSDSTGSSSDSKDHNISNNSEALPEDIFVGIIGVNDDGISNNRPEKRPKIKTGDLMLPSDNKDKPPAKRVKVILGGKPLPSLHLLSQPPAKRHPFRGQELSLNIPDLSWRVPSPPFRPPAKRQTVGGKTVPFNSSAGSKPPRPPAKRLKATSGGEVLLPFDSIALSWRLPPRPPIEPLRTTSRGKAALPINSAVFSIPTPPQLRFKITFRGKPLPCNTSTTGEYSTSQLLPATHRCESSTLSVLNNEINTAKEEKRCQHCGTRKTPQWREGPMGRNTVCNACGLRYKMKGML